MTWGLSKLWWRSALLCAVLVLVSAAIVIWQPSPFTATLAALILFCSTGLLWLWARSERRPAWEPRLAHAVDLWCSANPEHALDDDRVPPGVREAVETLVGHMRQAGGQTAVAVAEATSGHEQDRDLLRGLIEAREGALIVSTLDGRVLLYNASAQQLLQEDGQLGLGRSLFIVFRRWAISHFVGRLPSDGRRIQGVLVSRGGTVVRARFSRLLLGQREGLLLQLDSLDMQGQQARWGAQWLEPQRALLANLQAATETLRDHPDLPAEQARSLLEVVHTEAAKLGAGLAEVADALQGQQGLPLDDVALGDLLRLMADRAKLELDPESPAGLWVHAESASLVALVSLACRWMRAHQVQPLRVQGAQQEGHPVIRLHWAGQNIDAAEARSWQHTPVNDDGQTPWTPEQLLEWQGGTIWIDTHRDGGVIHLLLQPAAAPDQSLSAATELPARPEYFDFGLFDQALDREQQDQPLERLALTVFDTETTGLHPGQGDEIISIGAIRVLNGRLIGQELFESLVRTARPIHPESQKIHGIRAEMLADAPGQADALGRFLQFADNSILVGHNVAFDMRFLDLAGKRHQLRIPQLALDTLLLSAVVYPERDQHSLEAIAERLGVTVLGRHTSLGDALVTAEVLCRLLPLLQQKGIRTLGEAMAASRESWYARLAY